MIETIEVLTIKYCKQRGISIKDGQVSQEYKTEIDEFIKMQHKKIEARKVESGMGINNIVKNVMSKLEKS